MQRMCIMCRNALPSQRGVAAEILVAPSALSDFLRGRTVPSEDAVERLWAAALRSDPGQARAVPPLEHALRLRLQAHLSRRGLSDAAVVRRAAATQARLQKEGRIPPPAGPEADDAMRHLKAGRDSEAFTLFWNIGRAYTPPEIRDAVAAYRMAGRGDAALAVLASAAERDLTAVLRITDALHKASRHEDAAALVDAAVQHIT
ncbi:helix-turn-helix domain-containing protein [Streptomyces platensis]|uniref:helix-turn-helix domain-containing protein n=1 Tax=Streptomyces platensis TaxID=58346 RepID=UPI003793AE32